MRITFFILLFANLALLLWQTQIADSGQADALPNVPPDRRLVLLSEYRAQQLAQVSSLSPPGQSPLGAPLPEIPDIQIVDGQQEEPAQGQPATETEALCYTLGPFKDLNQARAVGDRLDDLGADVQRRSKVEQEQYGYRVYLPPYATREEALAESRKLAGLGIHDYFIITDDQDKKNGISLGLFRKKSGAIRRMAQVRRFDFKPQMEIRYRDTTIYWLDYRHSPALDSEPLWREITEDTPDIQRLDRNCDVPD
jgi:hypothetical protein